MSGAIRRRKLRCDERFRDLVEGDDREGERRTPAEPGPVRVYRRSSSRLHEMHRLACGRAFRRAASMLFPQLAHFP